MGACPYEITGFLCPTARDSPEYQPLHSHCYKNLKNKDKYFFPMLLWWKLTPPWSSVQGSWLQIQMRVQFPALPVFLRSGGSGTRSTQPREYNWRATRYNIVSSCSDLESGEYGRGDTSRWPCGTLYPQNLEISSPTRGGRSVGIVCSWTEATK
jgi:hypothetical protein